MVHSGLQIADCGMGNPKSRASCYLVILSKKLLSGATVRHIFAKSCNERRGNKIKKPYVTPPTRSS